MKLRIDPTKRPNRATSELHSDSKTLRYELENLVGMAIEYSPLWKKTAPIRNNAYVEAFALHCRALIFFLYGHLDEITANGKTERFSRSARKDDVFAYDFHRSWDRDCPAPSDVMLEAKWQANKHVAHVTIERREVNQPGSAKESVWPIDVATHAICVVMARFLATAPAQNFDPTELQRMNRAIADWQGRPSTSRAVPAPISSFQVTTQSRAPSGMLGVNTQGKTV